MAPFLIFKYCLQPVFVAVKQAKLMNQAILNC